MNDKTVDNSIFLNDAYFRCELLTILRQIAETLKEPRKCRKRLEELDRRVAKLEKDIIELYKGESNE